MYTEVAEETILQVQGRSLEEKGGELNETESSPTFWPRALSFLPFDFDPSLASKLSNDHNELIFQGSISQLSL